MTLKEARGMVGSRKSLHSEVFTVSHLPPQSDAEIHAIQNIRLQDRGTEASRDWSWPQVIHPQIRAQVPGVQNLVTGP